MQTHYMGFVLTDRQMGRQMKNGCASRILFCVASLCELTVYLFTYQLNGKNYSAAYGLSIVQLHDKRYIFLASDKLFLHFPLSSFVSYLLFSFRCVLLCND